MKVFGVFFILVLEFQRAMSENDFTDCSVPAICKRSKYVESVWMPMPPTVCKANAGPKGDKGEVGVGEIGKSGPKGENGTKGEPGSTDSLVALVKSIAMNVTQELQRRIECLEAKDAAVAVYRRPGPGTSFSYGGKHYHVIVFCSKLVSSDKLNPRENPIHLCDEINRRPADLLNAEHQTLVEQSVRSVMAHTATMEIFLPMLYNVTAQTIYWSNGTALSAEVASSFRWWTTQRYPILESTTLTALRIGITRSSSPEDSGLFNRHPKDPTNGVLCVMD